MHKQIPVLVFLLASWHLSAAGPREVMTPAQSILEVSVGDSIEVRLKQGSKLRGRLEAIRDTEFEITVPARDRLETRRIAFSEVESLKERKPVRGSSVALGILAGLGACSVVLILLLATVGYD